MGEKLFDTNKLIEMQRNNNKKVEGFTTIFNLIEFPNSLSYFENLKVLYPLMRDFDKALELSRLLYKLGKPIPAIDMLVASICYNEKLQFHTFDKHYSYVKEVWNDFNVQFEN